MSFEALGLSEPLLRAVRDADYSTPTPIQQQAIPPIAEGKDVLGCAQTGTGKTAAFAIPLLQQLHQSRVDAAENMRDSGRNGSSQARRFPKVLVLSPTRELAVQINDSFRKYGKRTKVRSVVIYGGVSQHPQTDALERGIDIIVATPGRLLDLMNQGFVDLSNVQSVVLDEADHMLDMGFLPDVRRILDHLPEQRQTLLFSATMPPDIQALAEQNMVDPVRLTIQPDELTAASISQSVYFIQSGSKPGFLIRLLKSQSPGTTLVFTRTKRNADSVVDRLIKAGIRAEAIHSNKSQNKRQRTLAAFRGGRLEVLVATDIAARGIDVRGISYVVNYDLPDVSETYTHRIGRTGRAGLHGVAITLCEASKKKNLRYLEKYLGYRLEEGPRLPEFSQSPKKQRQHEQDQPAAARFESRSTPDFQPRSEKSFSSKSFGSKSSKLSSSKSFPSKSSKKSSNKSSAKSPRKFAKAFQKAEKGSTSNTRGKFADQSTDRFTKEAKAEFSKKFSKNSAKKSAKRFGNESAGESTQEPTKVRAQGESPDGASDAARQKSRKKPVRATSGKPTGKKHVRSDFKSTSAKSKGKGKGKGKGKVKFMFKSGSHAKPHTGNGHSPPVENGQPKRTEEEFVAKRKDKPANKTAHKRPQVVTEKGGVEVAAKTTQAKTTQAKTTQVKTTEVKTTQAESSKPRSVKRLGKKPSWKKSRNRSGALSS